MAIIGTATVEIRASDKFFERDIRAAVKKIKDVIIDVKVNTDLAAARKKIADLKADQRKRPLNIKADIDLALVKAKLASLRARHAKAIEIDVKAHTGEATDKLNKMRSLSDKVMAFDVVAETAEADKKLRSIRENNKSSVARITAEVDSSAAHADLFLTARDRTARINAEANTMRAEARLAFVARDRSSNIRVGIDRQTLEGIKGIAYAITGALPMEKIKTLATGIAANFEMITIKAAKFGVILGSLGALAATGLANVLTISGDIVNTVGLLAMAPALLGATGIAVTTLILGFKDFGAALMGSGKAADEALAKLPPLAQDAVKSLKGLGHEIRVATQTKFWDALGTSLQDMVHNIFPSVKSGLEGSATALGEYSKEFFNVVGDMNKDGGLDRFFENTNKGFANAIRGIRPFNEAIGILASTGATFFPRMGAWFSNLGTSFNEWIVEAEKAGDITRWIEEAIDASQDLGDATVGLTRIFQGLTAASRASGAKGLHEFAQGLLNVAEVVQGEPFQSRLTEFLEGAREGTDFLGAAFGRLTDYIGKSSGAWAAFFSITGEIGGTFIDAIKTMFDGTGLGSGLYEALTGARTALKDMDPAFRNIGILIGDLGEIAGEMFIHMAPGFNQLMETVSKAVAGMKDGILAAMPAFNAFIQGFINLASGPIIAIATGFGNLLTTFSKIDPLLQTIILSIAAFLLLKNRLLGFFEPLRRSTEATRKEAERLGRSGVTMGDRLASGAEKARTHIGEIRSGFGLMGTALTQSLRDVRYYSAGVPNSFREVASETRKSFGQVGQSIRQNVANAAFYAETRFAQMTPRLGAIWRDLGTALMKDGGLDSIVKGFSDLRDRGVAAFQKLSAGAGNAAGAVQRAFQTATGSVVGYFRDIPTAFKNGMSGLVDSAHLAAGGVVNSVRDIRNTFSQGFRGVADVAKLHLGQLKNIVAQNVVAPITNGFKALPNAITGPIQTTGKIISTLGTIGVAAGTLAGRGIASGVSGAVKAVGTEISGVARTVASGMSPVFAGISQTAQGMGRDVANVVAKIGTSLSGAASVTAGAVTTATGRVATGVANAVRVSTGVLGSYATSVSKAVQSMSQSIATTAQTAAGHFKPVIVAAGNLGANLAGGFGGGLKSMGDFRAAAQLTAGAIGTGVGKGLVGAVGGLSGALGGPWGIAIMGAVALLGALGAANAKEKAKVDALSESLNKQSGAFTASSSRLIAESWLDTGRTSSDDFWRGFSGLGKGGAHNAVEIADMLGMDSKTITKAISNEGSRKAVVDAWAEIGKSTEADIWGIGKGAKNLASISDETLALAGTSRQAVQEMSNFDLLEMETRIRSAAETADKAQAKIRKLAEATGTSTVAAAALSANYEVLNSTTSSVSEKMGAFTANLRILSKGKLDAIETDKALKQSTDNYKAALESLKTVQNADGTTTTIDLKQFVDAAGKIDMTTQSARDMHTALSGAATGIQETAIAAFQASRGAGDSMETASLAAVKAIQGPVDSLRTHLKDSLGLSTDQINGILDQLGLVDGKVVKALITAEGEQAVNEILRVEILAAAFASGNWSAVLSALPDAAKKAIGEATDTANDFKTGNFTATIEALNGTPGGVRAALFDLALVADGKYESLLEAKDLTGPAVGAAKVGLNSVLAPPPLALTAVDNISGPANFGKSSIDALSGKTVNLEAIDKATKEAVEAQKSVQALQGKSVDLIAIDKATERASNANKALAGLTGKSVDIIAQDLASGKINDVANRQIADKSFNIVGFITGIPDKIRSALGFASGGIMMGSSQVFADGGFSKARAYASGGVEKHIAQITSPTTPIRIWSEPETGGEAYIPLNPAKRARSMAIFEEVAKIFGVGVVKPYANGGIEQIVNPNPRTVNLSRSVTGDSASGRINSGSVNGPVVNLTVNPSQGLSEIQIGQAAWASAHWNLQNRLR